MHLSLSQNLLKLRTIFPMPLFMRQGNGFLVKMGKYMCMCSVEMKRYTCW